MWVVGVLCRLSALRDDVRIGVLRLVWCVLGCVCSLSLIQLTLLTCVFS
jgi:hypothetical protein